MAKRNVRLLADFALTIGVIALFYIEGPITFFYLWFFTGIMIGVLIDRWSVLLLSLIPVSFITGVDLITGPSRHSSSEEFGMLLGIFIMAFALILPGFFGIAIGLLIVHAWRSCRASP